MREKSKVQRIYARLLKLHLLLHFVCFPLWICLFDHAAAAAAAGVAAPPACSSRTGRTHLFCSLLLGLTTTLCTWTFVLRLVLLAGVMSHSWRRPTARAPPWLPAPPAVALTTSAVWVQLTAGQSQKSRNVKFLCKWLHRELTGAFFRDFCFSLAFCSFRCFRFLKPEQERQFLTFEYNIKTYLLSFLKFYITEEVVAFCRVNPVVSPLRIHSYVVQIGGREMQLDGCQHICVRTYMKAVCCQQHWGPLCLRKTHTHTLADYFILNTVLKCSYEALGPEWDPTKMARPST